MARITKEIDKLISLDVGTKAVLIFLLNLTFNFSNAYAAPKGAVVLSPSQLFTSESCFCGFVREIWIPGRILISGHFYSRTAERSNLKKQVKVSSAAKKKTLLKKIKSLSTRLRIESPLCRAGPIQATPTATASGTSIPGAGPTAVPTAIPPTIALTTISNNLYQSEHALFIIPEPGQVTWTGEASWDSVYSSVNIDSYVNTLKTVFPSDYFFVVVTASNLLPNRVPNVLTYRQFASGIGQDSLTGMGVPNICRYHSDGPVLDSIYAVLDHEIGHNWGVFIGSELGEGHWRSNSNSSGQMAESYSDDGFSTIKRITGDPSAGFLWSSADNFLRQETETFSERDLYLQGLSANFPALHVLSSPVYNSDQSMSYSAVNTYDQAWVEARNGVRSPTYRNSDKRFRLGFIYVARDLAEVLSSYQPLERSIRQFVDAERVDANNFRFQVPFLVATQFRASIDARLSDLDGNPAPTLNISGASYASTTTGTATFAFTTSDSGLVPPVVSCLPASTGCVVSGNNVTVSGLSAGAHFYTIKAEDVSGKKVFAHFVVDAS